MLRVWGFPKSSFKANRQGFYLREGPLQLSSLSRLSQRTVQNGPDCKHAQLPAPGWGWKSHHPLPFISTNQQNNLAVSTYLERVSIQAQFLSQSQNSQKQQLPGSPSSGPIVLMFLSHFMQLITHCYRTIPRLLVGRLTYLSLGLLFSTKNKTATS